MTTTTKNEQLMRQALLAILTDKEMSAVSTMESVAHLDKGAEYLDLEELDLGVQTATRGGRAVGRVLPRTAVSDATWTKLLARLAS